MRCSSSGYLGINVRLQPNCSVISLGAFKSRCYRVRGSHSSPWAISHRQTKNGDQAAFDRVVAVADCGVALVRLMSARSMNIPRAIPSKLQRATNAAVKGVNTVRGSKSCIFGRTPRNGKIGSNIDRTSTNSIEKI